jgi:hypothetical protein
VLQPWQVVSADFTEIYIQLFNTLSEQQVLTNAKGRLVPESVLAAMHTYTFSVVIQGTLRPSQGQAKTSVFTGWIDGADTVKARDQYIGLYFSSMSIWKMID